jgi:intracellular multiplication protein IcmG
MSDNKNFDDEYQYIEEGENEPSLSEDTLADEKQDTSDQIGSIIQKPNVRRNAIIVIGALFLLIALIKCVSSPTFRHKENEISQVEANKPVQVQQPAPQATSQAQFQTAPPTPTPVAEANPISNVELNQLQTNQNNLQNSLANLNEQVQQLNTQMATISANSNALEQQLSQMQAKESTLISSIERLIAAQKTRHYREKNYSYPTYRVESIPLRYRVHFYVQAIIPGRAWLINSEGHTYTVRVGSSVPGYGVVQKIDPWQGRVVMSSGKILRFNQDL